MLQTLLSFLVKVVFKHWINMSCIAAEHDNCYDEQHLCKKITSERWNLENRGIFTYNSLWKAVSGALEYCSQASQGLSSIWYCPLISVSCSKMLFFLRLSKMQYIRDTDTYFLSQSLTWLLFLLWPIWSSHLMLNSTLCSLCAICSFLMTFVPIQITWTHMTYG